MNRPAIVQTGTAKLQDRPSSDSAMSWDNPAKVQKIRFHEKACKRTEEACNKANGGMEGCVSSC